MKDKVTEYTILKNSFRLEACNIFKTPLGLLTDGSEYGAFNIELSMNDNDADTLNFNLMGGDNHKLPWLVNENLVEMDGEYYIIKHISMDDAEISTYSFECQHEISSYKDKLNSKIDLAGASPEELITEVCKSTTEPLPIRFGGTDIKNKFRHLQSEEESVFSNLVTIAERFNARLKFVTIQGIIHVWLLEEPKDNGRYIERGRDLNSVSLEYDTDEMVTRLHYFGGTDPITGNEITMHDTNPTGKSYLEDFSYWTNMGYDLNTVKKYTNCIKELTIRNSELTTPEQVYQMAQQELSRICKPKLTANVGIVDLHLMPIYNLSPLELGEKIRVYDRERNLRLEATIVGINKYGEKPLDVSISLSNVIEINSALKDLVGTSQVVDKITNGGNMIQGVFVQVGKASLDVELFEHKSLISGNTTEITNNKASIEANSKEIALKVSEDVYVKDKEAINERVNNAEISIQPDNITATVTQNSSFTNVVNGKIDEKVNEYKTTVDKEFSEVSSAIDRTNTYIDGTFKDGILTEDEKTQFKVHIEQIEKEEKDIEKQYVGIYNNSLLINKATLKTSYDSYVKTGNDLINYLNSLLLLTNIEIGHVQEKNRLFTLYKEKLGAVKDRINLALDEISMNRTGNLESKVEKKFATLEVDINSITGTVGKHTETIGANTEKIETNKKAIQTAKDTLQSEIGDVSANIIILEGEMNGAFKDGVVDEAETKSIAERIIQLDKEKADLTKDYTTLYANTDLTGVAKTNLKSAYDDLISKYNIHKNYINVAIGDKKVDEIEKSTIATNTTNYNNALVTYRQRVNEAVDNIAQNKANKAENNSTEKIKVVKNEVANLKIESNKIAANVSSLTEKTEVIDGKVVNHESRLETAENKITPNAITNAVTENLNSGGAIAGTSTTITKDKFSVSHVGNKARVDIADGGLETFDSGGNPAISVKGTMISLYDWDRADRRPVGSIATTKNTNGERSVFLATEPYSNTVKVGHRSVDDGLMYPQLELRRGTVGFIYCPIDIFTYDFRVQKINDYSKGTSVDIDNLRISGNSLNGEWRTGGSGWLRLNMWHSNTVAIGAGNGMGDNYGTARANTFQVMKSMQLSNIDSKMASYSTSSVSETITDLGHGAIGENGETKIFFDNDFLKFADTRMSYFISYETVGRNAKDVKTYEKHQNYFIVGGEIGQEFSYRIECKKLGENSKRYSREIVNENQVYNGGLDTVEEVKAEVKKQYEDRDIFEFINNQKAIQKENYRVQMEELKQNKALEMVDLLQKIKNENGGI